MSTFEHIYQKESLRESDCQRENISIALTDQEYLERIRRDRHAMDCSFGMRKSSDIDPSTMSESMKKKCEIAAEVTKEDFSLVDRHEKSPSKGPKRKPKKDNPKSNKAAVARIQEEL